MGFSMIKPFPPAPEVGKREWAAKYFIWKQEVGENHSTELVNLVKEYGKGHPDYDPSTDEHLILNKQTVAADAAAAQQKEDDDVVRLKKSDLAKLLDGVEKSLEEKMKLKLAAMPQAATSSGEMRELVSELVEQLSATPGARRRIYYEDQIDKMDYLDEPIHFFTYRNYFAIFSEVRYGQEVKTPYGRPIKFTNISTHISGVGRSGKEVIQIAAAQINTKKEVEWLRKSPMFNVVFFETMRDASQVDKKKAAHLAQALTEISGLTEFQVMQRATSAGIAASKDIEMMKAQLIQLIAAKNQMNEEHVSRQAASSSDASFDQTLKRSAGATLTSY